MPTYDYKCPKCGAVVTVVRPIKTMLDPVNCDKCEYKGNMPTYFKSTPTVKFKCESPTKPLNGRRHGWQG